MKNILIPTDFSYFGSLSVKTGIEFSKSFGSALTVLHTAELPAGWVNGHGDKHPPDPTKQEIYDRAKDQLGELTQMAADEGVQVDTVCMGGNLITNIKTIIVDKDIDLIIMGSHGMSGKEEFFIGSNTQKVVRKVHVPVLVIKEPLEDFRFTKVLFASNLSEADQEAFQHFIAFLEPFNPEIVHVMAVDTTSYFAQPTLVMQTALEKFQEIASPLNCKTHFFKDYSVEAGIRHFSKDYGIDLIGISNHARHPLKRMFQGSNVELLVNHSDIPVLSIDY
jgi:nucleotide-binding universal stress UspA family protein